MALGWLVALAAAWALDLPWWVRGALLGPGLLWAQGSGWARWLAGRRDGERNRLALVLDAVWVSLGLTWFEVALVRELGLTAPTNTIALLALATAATLAGAVVARRSPRPGPATPAERVGAVAVVLAVLAVLAWRPGDLARPLDGYWWHADADAPGHETLALRPDGCWTDVQAPGWPEAGALRLVPGTTSGACRLIAEQDTAGRVIIAVRGPVGTRLKVRGGNGVLGSVEVRASVMEPGEDAPVRRYLDHGTMGIDAQVDLVEGEAVIVGVDPPASTAETDVVVYVLPSSDAVWALHAVGELRYTHYWQLLNQVENQDWANEVLVDRRFTLNQPPGWSPILATTVLLVWGDLPGANTLFLWVILFVGLSGVRLSALIAPNAPRVAFLVPAGLVAAHGLLMLEPASTNFPDSLYAAAVVGVATALASGRVGWFAALGIAAGLLRWPGVVVSSMLALAWWLAWRGDAAEPTHRRHVVQGMARLWGLTAVGGLLALGLALSGELNDLLFVLWFETFPEHWHGDYAAGSLLPRIPGFYALWVVYTGGGIALAAVVAAVGPAGETRRGLRALLAGSLAYSLVLCTIDHHPTHYFLPLVALTGPMVVAACGAVAARHRSAALGLSTVVGLGLWIFLWRGQVW